MPLQTAPQYPGKAHNTNTTNTTANLPEQLKPSASHRTTLTYLTIYILLSTIYLTWLLHHHSLTPTELVFLLFSSCNPVNTHFHQPFHSTLVARAAVPVLLPLCVVGMVMKERCVGWVEGKVERLLRLLGWALRPVGRVVWVAGGPVGRRVRKVLGL